MVTIVLFQLFLMASTPAWRQGLRRLILSCALSRLTRLALRLVLRGGARGLGALQRHGLLRGVNAAPALGRWRRVAVRGGKPGGGQASVISRVAKS